jgi:hypothetical protein
LNYGTGNKTMKSELSQTINELAHAMAAQSFAVIRLRLREQARAMAKEGKRPDEIVRVIQAAGLKSDTSKP